MAEIKDVVKLGIDGYKGNVEKYSTAQSQDVLREALIEANGGNTKLDWKAMSRGECKEVFQIVEEILNATVFDELQNDDFFNALVDFRNIKKGDQNLFLVEDNILFVVDEVADGTLGLRRQRIGGSTETTIPTSLKMVRIYEELNRVLAGRIDFNEMINIVAKSFRQKILDDIYTLWSGATAADLGGIAFFPAAGSYSEEDLLDLIAHVEAAAGGKQATIIGTKKACRQLAASIMADSAKEELHNYGYYGKFYGTPVIATPQRHKVGTTEFVFPDDVLTIIAGDEKPIKFVYEGEPFSLMVDPTRNADLTYEYYYGECYGLGIVLAGGNSGIGRYQTV